MQYWWPGLYLINYLPLKMCAVKLVLFLTHIIFYVVLYVICGY